MPHNNSKNLEKKFNVNKDLNAIYTKIAKTKAPLQPAKRHPSPPVSFLVFN